MVAPAHSPHKYNIPGIRGSKIRPEWVGSQTFYGKWQLSSELSAASQSPQM